MLIYLMRIPIGIKDDDSVCGLQIQTQTSSSGTQQEHEVLRILGIEQLQQVSTVFRLGGTIQTQVRVTWENV